MRQIVKDAIKISELEEQLVNINAVEDKVSPEDYLETVSDQELIYEAKYKISCFFESGHAFNDGLDSGDKEERAYYRKNLRQLQKFVDKYKTI